MDSKSDELFATLPKRSPNQNASTISYTSLKDEIIRHQSCVDLKVPMESGLTETNTAGAKIREDNQRKNHLRSYEHLSAKVAEHEHYIQVSL